MDQAGGTGSTIARPAGPEDIVVKESFESILNIPYVTAVLIDGLVQAEVWFSGDERCDRLRLSAADAAAAVHGQKSYASMHGPYGNATIYYSPYPDGGV